MSVRKLMTAASLTASALLLVAPAQAQTTLGCDDITFTGPILSHFPEAPRYCMEVVERDGEPYAHFNAEFVRRTGGDVELRFKGRDGGYHDPIRISPPEGQRIRVNGRDLRIRDLNRGDELDIYVPHDRFVAIIHDTHEEFVEAAVIEEYEIEPAPAASTASTLPSTASPMPLIGLLGSLFAALGFGGLALSRSRKA